MCYVMYFFDTNTLFTKQNENEGICMFSFGVQYLWEIVPLHNKNLGLGEARYYIWSC